MPDLMVLLPKRGKKAKAKTSRIMGCYRYLLVPLIADGTISLAAFFLRVESFWDGRSIACF